MEDAIGTGPLPPYSRIAADKCLLVDFSVNLFFEFAVLAPRVLALEGAGLLLAQRGRFSVQFRITIANHHLAVFYTPDL